MQKSCSDTFISCYTRNGNIKAKLKTTEKWGTVTSPDDTFKHGIYVDYVQMGCYATEYKSKPARNVHLSKIYGIIALKQKTSSLTAEMLGAQYHKNKFRATDSSSTAMAERTFWLNNTFQF